MHTRNILGLGTAGLALALAAPQLSAHHGWGGQSQDQTNLSGTLHKAVDISGPHATMQLMDADGQVWDVTLGPSSRTRRSGLVDAALPVGAQVTIRGQRNLDMNRYEMKTVRVTHAGTNYDVYPSRIK